MLIATMFVPLAGALAFALSPSVKEGAMSTAARLLGAVVAAVPLILVIGLWLRFDPGQGGFQFLVDQPWIPSVGAGLRFGVDGMSLALAALTALLFCVALVYPAQTRGRATRYVAWMLFLEAVCLTFFLTLDLLVFYVCFDLSLVGMYFLIGIWGHEDRERAALQFILYTFAGSLVMLLGILSLALAVDPISFDLRVLSERAEGVLGVGGVRTGLTFLALMFGLAVKTPLVPVHSWLPTAHVEAPAPVSAILAGILLKMGTYGMIRVVLDCFPETFRDYAWGVGILAVVSIVYGAFVAWGQSDLKRRIAYTSITHLGYTVLGISVAASTGVAIARRLALTGAMLEMVAHGLITGSLFLITGSLWRRHHTFEMSEYGGLMKLAPKMTVATVLAAFASLGMPALAGFVAEFQIFTGAVSVFPWLAGLGLLGVLITAVLFLDLLRSVFFGAPSSRISQSSDLGPLEVIALVMLLGLTVVIGVAPAFIVEVLDSASRIFLGGS